MDNTQKRTKSNEKKEGGALNIKQFENVKHKIHTFMEIRKKKRENRLRTVNYECHFRFKPVYLLI